MQQTKNSATYFKKKFKYEAEDVVSGLQELNSLAFWFEVVVHVECEFRALLHLEKRTLDDEVFSFVLSHTYATRYQYFL